MRKSYRKEGQELKYIVVTEYKNTKIHHHIIINDYIAIGSNTIKLIKAIWKKAAEEKAAKRREEKRAEEEKAAERRAERKATHEAGKYTVSAIGTDVKAVTQKVIAASIGTSAPVGTGFDIKA